MTTISERIAPLAPTAEECRLARELSRVLAPHLKAGSELKMQIVEDGKAGDIVAIPGVALQLLERILTEMANGNALALLSVQAELTTQQAAAILNVSRPFVIQLLDEGKIAYRRVGAHRRILGSDLLRYKQRAEAERRRVLAQLQAQAQELDMGYEV